MPTRWSPSERTVAAYPEVGNLADLRMWVEAAKAGSRFANLPKVLGEHWVHRDSFWHRDFKYAARQRGLAKVQAQAIRELGFGPAPFRWTPRAW